MDIKELLTSAKKIDDLVQSVWEKYDGMEGQDMPRDENWMLEYAILNRGHDFLNYFSALSALQKELESHEGEFCFSHDKTSHNGLVLDSEGPGILKIKPFSRGSYGSKSVLFQLKKPGLSPDEIRRVYNPETGRRDFHVGLGIGSENTFLISDLRGLRVEEYPEEYCCLRMW